MLRRTFALAFVAALAAAAFSSQATAQVQLTYPGGALTSNGNSAPPPHHWRGRCVQGYVWREAVDGDHVCVTPGTRQEAADDNAHAAERVSVHNQSYGADTCKHGYVWREAVPNDHVCVTPGTREQTADDNAHADSRFVH